MGTHPLPWGGQPSIPTLCPHPVPQSPGNMGSGDVLGPVRLSGIIIIIIIIIITGN